jgi:cystathionine beta-lyase/cystathionine gamma-synthase
VPALKQITSAHNLKLIIDNTFLSPFLLRPIEQGADFVVHSATKYLCGHGDTVAGVLAGSRESLRAARFKLDSFGQCISPLNSWLLQRGIRTLPLRMRQHCANGLALAQFLERHSRVEWIRYPGLASHPQHESAQRQYLHGYGGMFSFKLHGGLAEMNRFANALKLCDIGVSLGDVFTLVYPRPKNGNLLRVSVGCEDIEDLMADFDQALAA